MYVVFRTIHRGQLKITTQSYACKADWHILSLDQHYDKRLVKCCLIGLTVKHTNIHLIGLMSSDVQIYKWSLHSACQRRATKVLYEIWTKEKANEVKALIVVKKCHQGVAWSPSNGAPPPNKVKCVSRTLLRFVRYAF